jgi:peptidoglycan/LPS O-acetylase OafA/YrhL
MKWRERPPGKAQSALWLALGLGGFAFIAWLFTGGTRHFAALAVIYLVLAAQALAMLGLVARGVGWARPILANKPLRWVGLVSYSAYLYHVPLLLAWNKLAAREAGGASFPLYIALVLGVAWLSYRYVERPFMRGSWLSGRARAGAKADGERGADGEALQERHAP